MHRGLQRKQSPVRGCGNRQDGWRWRGDRLRECALRFRLVLLQYQLQYLRTHGRCLHQPGLPATLDLGLCKRQRLQPDGRLLHRLRLPCPGTKGIARHLYRFGGAVSGRSLCEQGRPLQRRPVRSSVEDHNQLNAAKPTRIFRTSDQPISILIGGSGFPMQRG